MKTLLKMLMLISVGLFLFASEVNAGYYDITVYEHPHNQTTYLSHGKWYRFEFGFQIPEGESILAATLKFENIKNDDWRIQDRLFAHILDDDDTPGPSSGNDSTGGVSDQWESDQDGFIAAWAVPWYYADATYSFDAEALDLLISYLGDDYADIGVDPDCYYKIKCNGGIYLHLETGDGGGVIPEPCTLLLMGSGIVGFAGTRRFRAKS
jgi:hypothetical protein